MLCKAARLGVRSAQGGSQAAQVVHALASSPSIDRGAQDRGLHSAMRSGHLVDDYIPVSDWSRHFDWSPEPSDSEPASTPFSFAATPLALAMPAGRGLRTCTAAVAYRLVPKQVDLEAPSDAEPTCQPRAAAEAQATMTALWAKSAWEHLTGAGSLGTQTQQGHASPSLQAHDLRLRLKHSVDSGTAAQS